MAKPAVEVVGLTGLMKKLEDVHQDIFTKALFDEIAFFVITRIKNRTAKGVDVSGSPFDAYSPKYSKFRSEQGHSVNKVNLFFSGSMMSSMTFESRDDRTRIFFLPTQDASGTSNPLKAFALNQKRRFFAINQSDVDGIMRIVRANTAKLIVKK